MEELHVRTRSGVLIPDIVVHRDNSAWIIDVAISADNDVNDFRYNQKVQHYSSDDLKYLPSQSARRYKLAQLSSTGGERRRRRL